MALQVEETGLEGQPGRLKQRPWPGRVPLGPTPAPRPARTPLTVCMGHSGAMRAPGTNGQKGASPGGSGQAAPAQTAGRHQPRQPDGTSAAPPPRQPFLWAAAGLTGAAAAEATPWRTVLAPAQQFQKQKGVWAQRHLHVFSEEGPCGLDWGRGEVRGETGRDSRQRRPGGPEEPERLPAAGVTSLGWSEGQWCFPRVQPLPSPQHPMGVSTPQGPFP